MLSVTLNICKVIGLSKPIANANKTYSGLIQALFSIPQRDTDNGFYRLQII